MTEFDPPHNWKWNSPIRWLTVIYDHRFEALDADHTRLIFVVQAHGFGAGIIGPLFARVYRGNLEKAIPRLVREMNAIRAGV